MPELHWRSPHNAVINTPNFSVHYDLLQPDYFEVQFKKLSQRFYIPAGCDTLTARDLTIRHIGSEVSVEGSLCIKISARYSSTLWLEKSYHIDVYTDRLEFWYSVTGQGAIDTVRYFEGIEARDFSEHILLTKHFNDKKSTAYREYSKASPIGFSSVFNPEPNNYAKHCFQPFEYSQISANSDLDYCGGNFIFNPGLLCFLVTNDMANEWITLGLVPNPGEFLFSEYEYSGGIQFGLNLNYWGAMATNEGFRSPRVVICNCPTKEDALRDYVAIHRFHVQLQDESRAAPKWWRGPLVCGWGHQSYKSDLFRIRSPKDRPADSSTYYMCTQAHYEEFVALIDQAKLPWQTLVIDARWTISAGEKRLDVGRWPDLRGFVDSLHDRGKRILIWWGMWDTEGIEPEECITFASESAAGKVNRPGRLAKFGLSNEGLRVAPDPTLPTFLEKMERAIHVLLSSEPGCYDLDGFKIDHVAAVPGMYGLTFPPGSRHLYGIELLRYYHRFIYQTCKREKPDALVIGQSANPYFADCMDMLRLGDIYSHREDVIPAMRIRAEMARIAHPQWLIDADNWPIPSLKALLDYMRVQPELGVPSLYYASHIDTTGEAISREAFEQIRSVWDDYNHSMEMNSTDEDQ